VFDARYDNDETGATAIHPKILLKVILMSYNPCHQPHRSA